MNRFIAKEGWTVVFTLLGLLLLVWIFWGFSFILLLAFLAFLFLFRASKPYLVCNDEKAILAPIDGRITRIENAYYEDFGECLELNIKNAFYDCGSLSAPIKMQFEKLTLRHGLFLCSELEVAKKMNERMIIRAFAGDKSIIMRICAGSLDRKLKLMNNPHHLNAGDKMGFLLNGSISLLLPKDTRVHVGLNDEIKAGSLLAYLS
ncbi:phosphatidylserine decarboxylase [Campylobacter vulpis]|uniref:phosphatidylserine decarboxylase n=1 Tax=Campylobacter vulpis TaxID=1655500 RepID=UPI001BCCFBFE|nr:phosphatidylserine decarboxylase [Campylobacter vulpis]MBS4281267.1 phosphatidylserine decarboxylase [Campylobacter vulpis]